MLNAETGKELFSFEGQPVGMALVIPNLNRVIQPLKGKLFPFGWARLLWGAKVKRPNDCRLTLLGLRPEFRGLRAGGKGPAVHQHQLVRLQATEGQNPHRGHA